MKFLVILFTSVFLILLTSHYQLRLSSILLQFGATLFGSFRVAALSKNLVGCFDLFDVICFLWPPASSTPACGVSVRDQIEADARSNHPVKMVCSGRPAEEQRAVRTIRTLESVLKGKHQAPLTALRSIAANFLQLQRGVQKSRCLLDLAWYESTWCCLFNESDVKETHWSSVCSAVNFTLVLCSFLNIGRKGLSGGLKVFPLWVCRLYRSSVCRSPVWNNG